MANVTDSNAWREIAAANAANQSPHFGPRTPSGVTSPALAVDGTPGPEVQMVLLSEALRHWFSGSGDRVVWNVHSENGQSEPNLAGLVRIDQQHPIFSDEGRAESTDDKRPEQNGKPEQNGALETAGQPWLVVVHRLRDLMSSSSIAELKSVVAGTARLLFVACESDDGATDSEDFSPRTLEILTSTALPDRPWEYIGPVALTDPAQLLEVLGRVKQGGQATLLHVKTHPANGVLAPPHIPLRREPPAESLIAVPDGRFHPAASQMLAQRAAVDARITVVSTLADDESQPAWQTLPQRFLRVESDVPHALQWCASVASTGLRPVAFLSLEELQNSFGQLRQEICLKRAAVTLIVEPRGDSLAAGNSGDSAALAGIRQLPNLVLLSPKDCAELQEMLDWCLTQSAPAVIWLPQPSEFRSWAPAAPIALGTAEQLRSGDDVAIVAFGPMVNAAITAADSLAALGVRATVVSARFAQPLDVEGIVRCVRNAQCAVLLDDTNQTGGFAGWVLEHLLHSAVTAPISVIRPQDSHLPHDAHLLQNQCALRIVESCRWLSQPLAPASQPWSSPIDRTSPTDDTGSWLQLAPSEAAKRPDEQQQVLARRLSADIRHWVAAYEKVGTRDLYLWKWCNHGVEITTLPCVVPQLRAHVCDTKVLSIILCVLLDDVADQHGNSELLDALLEITSWQATGQRAKYNEAPQLRVLRDIWLEYRTRVASYPRFQEFEPVLRYDLLQFFNTMRYSHLVNSRPYLLNMAEHDLYTSHNMMIVSFSTLDLMCSPRFPTAEIGILRETMWHAQCMGRIGNLLSTWRRELADRDFTSGVFARAVIEGDLTLDELEHGDLAAVEANILRQGHDTYFFEKWLDHRRQCHARAKQIRSLDMTQVLDGHDRFFDMHLGSQGLI